MGSACQVFDVRTLLAFLLASTALALSACVDAPITEAHMTPDGHLAAFGPQSPFAAAPSGTRGQAVQVAAVLATQADGPLEDAAVFPAEAEAVHLHLRADSLMEPRPVTFVWTHAGEADEASGVLAPSPTLALAASHPLGPDQRGLWEVAVYGFDAAGGRELLFRREFQVL
jgi:hypothetical protein